MDVFDLRKTLVSQYRQYVQSFIRIRDELILARVNSELDKGLLWPVPLVQLNPFFERGKGIQGLVDESVLTPACADIFRRLWKISEFEWLATQSAPAPGGGHSLCQNRSQSYVLTTGANHLNE